MPTTAGLIYRKELKIGIDELQWLQAENHQRARDARLAMTRTPGLLVTRRIGPNLDHNWRAHDDDDNGVLTIDAGAVSTMNNRPAYSVACDEDGYLLVLLTDLSVVFPDDNTWYTVLIGREETQYEVGALTLAAGSNVVLGTGTRFTRYSGVTTDGYGRGTRIRIIALDSPGGNAGTYEVDVVVSDTELHTVELMPGANEAGVAFTVAGDYAITVPLDPDIHLRDRVSVSRVARTRDVPAGFFALCDAKRNDAAAPRMRVIDRREENLWRLNRPDAVRGLDLQPQFYADTVATPNALFLDYDQAYSPVLNAISASICTRGTTFGNLLVAAEDNGNVYIAGFNGINWANITNWVGLYPAIVRVPVASGFSHVCFYIVANVLYCRRSTDAGATWSGAILVLDPTLVDPADTCNHPAPLLLQCQRLSCAVTYSDASAGQTYISVANSDDYGATWAIAAGQGFTVKSVSIPPTSIAHPYLAQDDSGQIFCAYQLAGTTIGLTSSEDKTGEWAGILAGTPDQVLGLMAFFTNVVDPALWISPDGHLCIFYASYLAAGNDMSLRVAVLGYGASGYEIHSERRLFYVDQALGAVQPMGLSVCQDAAGLIRLTWIDTQPAVLHPVRAMALRPVPLPIASYPVRD